MSLKVSDHKNAWNQSGNQPGCLWPRLGGCQSCLNTGLESAWSVACRPPSLPSSECLASTADTWLYPPPLLGSSWRSRWTSAPEPFAKSQTEWWVGDPGRRCTCSPHPSLASWWSWRWYSRLLCPAKHEWCQLKKIFFRVSDIYWGLQNMVTADVDSTYTGQHSCSGSSSCFL